MESRGSSSAQQIKKALSKISLESKFKLNIIAASSHSNRRDSQDNNSS
jgi:hypothetical protein